MIIISSGNLTFLNSLDFIKKDSVLIASLLEDIEELNNHTDHPVYLACEDLHTEYSPERIDPCPDYYGMFYILDKDFEICGEAMTLDEVDLVLCILSDIFREKSDQHNINSNH